MLTNELSPKGIERMAVAINCTVKNGSVSDFPIDFDRRNGL